MWWRTTKTVVGRRLMLALLICVLPVAALTAYLSQARRADGLKHTQEEAQLIVRFVADQLSKSIADTERLLSSFAQEYAEAGGGRFDCQQSFGLALRAFPLYGQIVLADSNGNVRCSAKPLRGPSHIGDRDYFQRAATTQEFVMSDAIQGRDSGNWTIVAARPVVDTKGENRGMIVAALDLDELNERLARTPLPVGAILSVVDASGKIVARLPGAAQYAGKTVQEPQLFAAAVTKQDRGVSRVTTLDGVKRVVAYTRLPSAPYYVRVGLPEHEVDAAALRILYSGLFTLAVVLALALAAAWAVSHYLVAAPLREIIRSAQRLYDGKASERTGIAHDHPVIGNLAAALDTLAAKWEQVGRALKTLSGGNRTLLREQTEHSLLHEMCRVAVEVGGYPLAFVTYKRDDEARSVEVMAQHGRSDGFVESLHVSWGDDQWGRGVTGTAIRTGRHCVFRSLSDEPLFDPWRDEALKRGFRSIISLPLLVDGTVIGALTLLASEEDAFDRTEVELLDEMAADLSFGIAGVRSRAKRIEAEAAAEHARTRDPITGLVNRTVFANEVEKLIRRSSVSSPGAIVVLHLTRLQDVFDGFGYAPGDDVVKEIGRRLAPLAEADHGLARVSFSDFGIVVPHGDGGAVARRAHAMLAAIDHPISVNSVDIAVHGAVGASFFPEHGDEAELLIRRAAIAAREGARRHIGYFKYRGGIERENPARLALAAELAMAIQRQDLALHYQPKLDLLTNRLSGREGLIRWFHGTRGAIPPAQFIPIAEHTGLIHKVSEFVLEEGVRQQRLWVQENSAVPLALNLSARDLYERKLVQSVAKLLDRHGVPPHLIDFELTESALIDDSLRAREVLKGIRDLGMKIYVDDFGTGYCALSYLTLLPVSGVKIDRSFVSRMTASAQAESLVSSIITMAHELELSVVAEGVETGAELERLRAMGCDEVQGYFIGKPAAA